MKKDNKTFFYSGTDGGKHENGVGFMVNEKVLHNIKTFIPVDDRICYIKIAGRLFDLVIINCYAPTEDKDDETKDKFYDELERVVNSLPTHCIKMIVGDLNAKVGRETMYRPTTEPDSLHETSNDNGTRLIHFATSKEFTISSTYFPRKDIYKSTWISPNGRVHNQIDHIVINKRHASSIRKVRTYRGADADSDHYLLYHYLFAQFNLRLSTKWNMVKKIPREKYNLQRLADPEALERFVGKVHGNIQGNQPGRESEAQTVNSGWSQLKEAVIISASETLSIGKRMRQKSWFNQVCKEAIDKRNELRKTALQNPSIDATDKYKEQRKTTNKILRREKRQFKKERIEKLEINRYKTKIFFNIAGNIKAGSKPQTKILTNKNGTLITDGKQIVNEFKDFFEKLLNRPLHNTENEEAEFHTVEPEIEEPSHEKIDWSVDGLKNNKAPGKDGVVAELLKKGGTALRRKLTEFIKEIWRTETIPDEWNTAIICPIFKKGNPAETENYRE
ncbi:uncharacterized protein LOC126844740 [Adelges cooleyi]|uniref:uncharacterized protein LOC126844740 n=1 Tax=Adelges cooleyi TaxID=133065 RepID=UPI00217F3767|nr:uncharacterized protein LOC126844740 [Adelges cooleyi]